VVPPGSRKENQGTILRCVSLQQIYKVMPNIYYCHPINGGSGILRAVLSSEEVRGLLAEHATEYAGQQLPTGTANQTDDFAVLRISEDELGKKWQAGFYMLDGDIAQVEQTIQACTAKLSLVRPKPQASISLAYTSLVCGGGPREQDSGD
jgi:hypothetical protein